MTTPQSSTPWRVLLLTLALMALAACGSSPQVTPTPDGGTTTHGTGGSGGTGGTTAGTGGTGNGGADAGSGGGQGGGGAATCTVDADCGGATPKCAPATHHCVACTASSDCGSPSLACAPATGTCELACATSNDCPEGQPVCDPLAGVCVAASCSTEFGCFAWQEGAWTACGGGTCSGGGTQTRAVTCLDSAGEVASDSACSQPKPDTAQACTDLTACFYHWAGTWGACSTTCGVGTQARTLTCQRSDGATVPDSFCTDPKPDTSQTCSDDSGCPYQWVGTWGACSTTCGAGTQTRAVTCQRASDGATVADSFCSALPKPAGTQACTDTSACTYAWLPSAWSACGTTCGTGAQTRTLTCQRSDGAMVADSFCASATKPATTQPCTDTSLCTYQWVGTWGACSSTCGAGTQTRALVCQRVDGTAVADSLCPQPKPDTTQACNGTSSCAYQWVGPWGACSAACGTGTQTRTLTCQRVSDGATVPDSDCQAVPAPPTSQVCTAYAGCTYSWVASGFGACSGACGAGTQTQTVACRRSDGAPVADASCDPASKPPTSQPCSAGPCPPPTCTLSIAPSSGGASTTFTASWASSSNGATFQYSYDGGAYQPAPPTGWLQFLGSGYPVGAHTFNVQVTNADGTGTCSTGFTISPAPTCNVSVTPVSGTAGTTFTAGWTSSNATLCTWSLNGVDQGSAPCDGSASFPGSQFGDGTYAIAVSAAGPGGVGTCSTSFSVGTTSAPVCSISVSPTTGGYTTASGGTNTSFTASWTSSNATSCSWSLNGVSQGAVPCDGSAAFTGSQLGGKGTYSIVLTIAGPGGNNACSTSVSLVDAPTCTLNVTPTSGLTTTTFTANWSTSSDATSAAFYVDTASIGSGSCASGFCTGSTMVLGSLVGPGAHTVYLRPTGPGGTGSCSVSIYVGTPNPPTCSISVTPTSGYTSTTYAANWSSSSDATSCTWSLDGVSQGAIACAGGTSFTGAAVGAGNHTVSLQPTGPGGTGSCTASFQTTGAPTCSVQASSASVSWSSANAISCTFIGSAIPCSGTQPGPIPSGTYCLDATNPSGTTQCCGTVP